MLAVSKGSTALAAEQSPRRQSKVPTKVADEPVPYTVDRWIGQVRRSLSPSAAARARVTEPITESPLPQSPAVETHRGARKAAR
jgi:hypothetical protein